MGLEFELKYAAAPEQLSAIRTALPGEYIQIPMTTSYFDTPSGAISARYWTLRHRREGDTHICTLKTPAGDSRNEWECNAASMEEGLPQLIRLSGLEELANFTQEGLVLSCCAAFTRLARSITIGHSVAELALDQGVLKNGSKETPFSEMEVELKSGDPEEVRRFAEDLAAQFGLKPQPLSKFARAKALGREG